MFELNGRNVALVGLLGALAAPAALAQQETIRDVTVAGVHWSVDGCYFSQSQEITCRVTITNTAADKRVGLYQASIVDSTGTEVNTTSWGFGQNEAHQTNLVSGLAIPLVLRFRPVSPQAKFVARLMVNPGGDAVVWNNVALGSGPSQAGAGSKSWQDKLKEKAGLTPSPTPAPTATAPAATATPAAAAPPAQAAASTPSKMEQAKAKFKGLFGKKDAAPAASAATAAK